MLGEFLTGFQTCNALSERLFRSYNQSYYEDVHLEYSFERSWYHFIKIKVSKTSNQLTLDDMKLTTATEAPLKPSSVNKDAKENLL